MAATVADFVQRTGTFPVAGPDVAQEAMAGWLAAQRRADQQGRLSAERRAVLDASVPGWRRSRNERWADALKQAAAATTPVSGPVKVWLKTQRRAAASGTLAPERRAVLDARVPGWDRPSVSTQSLWQCRAEDLANFADFAGRLPGSAAKDTDEAGLYRWMSYQRSLARAGTLPKARRKWLDKNVPGWLPDGDWRDLMWSARAQELTDFLRTHGRRPRVAVKAENPLARWLGTQCAAARAGRLSAPRHERLDAISADWLRPRRGE